MPNRISPQMVGNEEKPFRDARSFEPTEETQSPTESPSVPTSIGNEEKPFRDSRSFDPAEQHHR